MGLWVSSQHSGEAKQFAGIGRLQGGLSLWAWPIAGWLAVSLLTLVGGTAAVDRWLMDTAGRLAGAPPEAADIQLVAIDPASFQDLGMAWPWPRTVHAELVDAATQAGARAVVFDIVFDAETGADSTFAEAIAAHGKVALAAERSAVATPQAVLETYAPPTQQLAEAAATIGVAALPIDPDGRLRRLPLAGDSMPYQVARMLGVEPKLPAPGREHFIRYRGDAGLPAPVSYYQALDPDEMLPPGALRDKILLVGLALPASPDATSFVGDEILTPSYAGGARTGVSAHAEALATTLAGDARVQSPVWARVWLLALAFAASLALVRLAERRLPHATIATIVGLALIPLAVVLAWRSGSALEAGAPLLGLAAAVLPYTLHTGAHAFIQRRRLESRFAKYVSPQILQKLRDHPTGPELGGEEREVSIIVTDLEGFTSFMEARSAADGAAIMRDYLGQLAQVVLAHGGMIDQFIGDSVVAIFNAPLDQPDHAQRALGCAIELERAGQGYRETLAKRGIAFGRTRVGAHCGAAVVGNFGSQERFHFTAIGDVVNTASRLEAACKHLGVGVLLSDDLQAAAGSPQDLLPIGPLLVEGRATAVSAYTSVSGVSPEFASVYRQAYERRSRGESLPDGLLAGLSEEESCEPLLLRLLQQGSTGEALASQSVSKA